jgi:hypothetical protein
MSRARDARSSATAGDLHLTSYHHKHCNPSFYSNIAFSTIILEELEILYKVPYIEFCGHGKPVSYQNLLKPVVAFRLIVPQPSRFTTPQRTTKPYDHHINTESIRWRYR